MTVPTFKKQVINHKIIKGFFAAIPNFQIQIIRKTFEFNQRGENQKKKENRR